MKKWVRLATHPVPCIQDHSVHDIVPCPHAGIHNDEGIPTKDVDFGHAFSAGRFGWDSDSSFSFRWAHVVLRLATSFLAELGVFSALSQELARHMPSARTRRMELFGHGQRVIPCPSSQAANRSQRRVRALRGEPQIWKARPGNQTQHPNKEKESNIQDRPRTERQHLSDIQPFVIFAPDGAMNAGAPEVTGNGGYVLDVRWVVSFAVMAPQA